MRHIRYARDNKAADRCGLSADIAENTGGTHEHRPDPPEKETASPDSMGFRHGMREVLRVWATVLVLSGFGLVLVRWTWLKWADLLVDVGHELYIPWRLLCGDVLYRDIAHTMGPLSQYLNAGLFACFGVSVRTLVLANLVFVALLVWMLHAFFHRVGDRVSATAVCLAFLGVFAFNQYNLVGGYNYVCPYRHELVHGLFLGVLQILLSTRYLRASARRKPWILGGVGICVGGNLLLKAETLLPSAGALVLFVVFVVYRRRPRRVWPVLRRGWPLFAGAIVLPLVFWITLGTQLGMVQALDGLSRNVRYVFRRDLSAGFPFYAQLMGIDHPWRNLLFILRVSVFAVSALVGCALLAYACGRSGRFRWPFAVGLALGVGGALWLAPLTWWLHCGRVLPFVAAAGTAFYGRACWREVVDGHECERLFALLLWSAFALLFTAKMVFRAWVGHYGFVLVMPAGLLAVHLLYTSATEQLKKVNVHPGMWRLTLSVIMGCCVAGHLRLTAAAYRMKTQQIGEGADLVYHAPAASPAAVLVAPALDSLQKYVNSGRTMLVLPAGSFLNYLLRIPNPTPYVMLTPWELRAFGGEQRIVERIARDAPDIIVHIGAPMRVFDRGTFGEPGYGRTIMEWVAAHYRVADRLVALDEDTPDRTRCQVLVLTRRPALTSDRD